MFLPLLTQQDRSDVDVQSLLGSNPHLETWRVETAGGLLLPGQGARPGLNEGLPAWHTHTHTRTNVSYYLNVIHISESPKKSAVTGPIMKIRKKYSDVT